MISLDTLTIGAPVLAFLILAPLGFLEYCWIERARRREQLARAAAEIISGPDSTTAAIDTRAAAAE
jgi:hypothetical protein